MPVLAIAMDIVRVSHSPVSELLSVPFPWGILTVKIMWKVERGDSKILWGQDANAEHN